MIVECCVCFCSHTHIDIDARHSIFSQHVNGRGQFSGGKVESLLTPSEFDAALKEAFKTDPVTVSRNHWVLDVKTQWQGWWGVTGGYGNVSSKTKHAIEAGGTEWEAHLYRVFRDEDGNVVLSYKKNELLEKWWPLDAPIKMFSSTAPVDDIAALLRHPGHESPTEWTNRAKVQRNLVGGYFKGMSDAHIQEWRMFFDTVPEPSDLPSLDNELAFKWTLPALYERAKLFKSLPPVVSIRREEVEFNPEPDFEVLTHACFTKADRRRERGHRVEDHQLQQKVRQEIQVADTLRLTQKSAAADFSIDIEESSAPIDAAQRELARRNLMCEYSSDSDCYA